MRFGTLVSDVIEECGGLSCEPGKIIGGPMMGVAQHTVDIPITKGVSGIVFMPRDEVKEEEILPCIRCAKCIQVCPIRLMPLSISAHSLRGEYDTCETLHAWIALNVVPAHISVPLKDHCRSPSSWLTSDHRQKKK